MRPSFSAGAVLHRSVSVWARNLLPFFLVALVAYLPVALLGYAEATGELALGEAWARALQLAGGAVLGMVTTGATAFGVFEELRGAHAGVLRCLRVGLSRLPGVIGLGVLLVLIFIGAGVFLLLAASVVAGLLSSMSRWVAVVAAASIVGLPLVALYCRFYVAVPSLVVERVSAAEALHRSTVLTEGRRLRVFGIVAVLQLANLGLALLLHGSLADEPMIFLLVSSLCTVTVNSLAAVTSAMTYRDLRLQREGVGIDELAAVFD